MKIMMNVGNPETAFTFGQLPNDGIGLARLEFVINNAIGVHPKALLNYDTRDADTKALVDAKMKGYGSPKEFYVQKIVEGVATLAASVYPKRIIVRLSDFKSNEYKSLIGGDKYEPAEEFLEYFDGFSIGSNDLTQLTLGLDRDSGLVA